MERIADFECESCKNTIREIIAILDLEEYSSVIPVTVTCCAQSMGGTCTVPLPCPQNPVIAVTHVVDLDILEKRWVEKFCIHELVSDTRRCVAREARQQEPVNEFEFVNSIEKAIEILKKFGLGEQKARELVGI